MIIQHNIMAINSHRQLGINNTNLGKNLEKLSSGYRINRAADDAAGLAISEKMRAQITGLNRAVLNAQDGASLIQTAEGALQEVHSMLNRMVELATQSANGTIQASDRQKIEAETTALKEEIDRISKATNFNGIQLLDGSLSTTTAKDINVTGVKVGETAAIAGSYMYTQLGESGTGFAGLVIGDTIDYTVSLNNGDSFTFQFEMLDGGKLKSLDDGTIFVLGDTTSATITANDLNDALETQFRKSNLQNDFIINMSSTGLSLTSRVTGTAAPQVTGISFAKNGANATQALQAAAKATGGVVGTDTIKAEDEISTIASSAFTVFSIASDGTTNEDIATFEVNGHKFVLADRTAVDTSADYRAYIEKLQNSGVNIIQMTTNAEPPVAADLQRIAGEINQKTGLAFEVNADDTGIIVKAPKTGNGLTMQVGDTADAWNKITVSVDNMSSAGLGIQNISMATQESASRALDRINAAIEKVSVNRGNLGALQNRLEYTINNLNVTSENMTAAESRIRDVDMAKEMMAFTKNNVLSQAAQAMLAQANQQPQNVLQLLR